MRNADDRRSHSPATRRNGSLQSCEPCRRSKQRCDHERPVCRRCAGKRINDQCFYHPAPMTRRRSDHANPPLASSSRLTSQPTSNASSPGSLGGARSIFAPLDSRSALPGYLGSTSFTAVLAEHRNEILFEPEESTDVCRVLTVEPDRVQSGAEVLLFLYNMKERQKLIDRFYLRTWNAVVPEIIMRAMLTSLGELFDSYNLHNLMPELQKLATQIFQNSSRPMAIRESMTVQEYCDSFTGRNFRWEAIGNIFSICGQQLAITPDNDPDFSQGLEDPRAKDRLLEQVVVASMICLNFCDQASSANELLAYLQYNDVMLQTQQYGDSSYQAWRRLGDLIATVYAAGLHTDGEDAACPFFLRQWRRGCFISAFYMDKSQASFVGRPPLMNYRYCTIDPPLDLSDEVLVEGGEALNKAISELDSRGWNTHGGRYRMTPSRLRFLLGIYREQTLELALGIHQPQDIIQRTQEIKEKIRDVWESTPDQICYDRRKNDDLHDGWLTIVYMYLNYLYTCFLLQRTLIKHTNTGQEALCEISRQTLGIVISITSIRSPMVDLDRHFSWIALTYGLPTASVLLLELLRQSHEPGPHNVELPRSELIRNLSVFVSLLSWVSRPGHGNYHTCKEAEKKLSRILDQLLDPQPVHAEMVHDVTSGLSNFLNWSNYNGWDFNSEYFPAVDGYAP
ncbi:hypothetical protein N7532_003918 [Penicillium argentinense]|uniref:Zn(2)-C6 fungal-type domain-containing protein n=1 Tax=Penicillium argentinense TaxID=1131581 RepID=A0A9W9FNC8_9EURO|nr:uncharacterized protein N7532_003918 [Penicillium argentinense]KAJ5103389.1 hypothetical protein N7532_003918 [Penicillium argentinense]